MAFWGNILAVPVADSVKHFFITTEKGHNSEGVHIYYNNAWEINVEVSSRNPGLPPISNDVKNSWTFITTPDEPYSNKWFHLMVTWSGTEECYMKVYFNGSYKNRGVNAVFSSSNVPLSQKV